MKQAHGSFIFLRGSEFANKMCLFSTIFHFAYANEYLIRRLYIKYHMLRDYSKNGYVVTDFWLLTLVSAGNVPAWVSTGTVAAVLERLL